MSKFLREIKVTVCGNLRELNFQTPEDMRRWLDAEEPFWKSLDIKSMNQFFQNHWNSQINFYASARQHLSRFEEELKSDQEQLARQSNDALVDHFNQVANGNVVTSDFEIYPAIVDMATGNPDVAGLLYLFARSDSAQTLGVISKPNQRQALPVKTILDLILLYVRSKGSRDWLLPQRRELTALKDELQAALDSIGSKHEEQNGEIEEQRKLANEFHELRVGAWSAFKEELAEEWKTLKKVYDEQLALLAPTQYWGDRATAHRNVAIAFAVAFGLVLAASIGLFSWLAMPHMFAVAGNKEISPILTLVPIAIPAFAGVWVLKMFSRLLSENLQMMRDARERETMVKTFLALMRDDKNGKSIVNDNDRILILHSLFRPSSVTAVDDAPPVHWFDILTNKVGSKDSKK
ncbi:DUF6161 domain-containing protein [Bordetella bronchiseptica]